MLGGERETLCPVTWNCSRWFDLSSVLVVSVSAAPQGEAPLPISVLVVILMVSVSLCTPQVQLSSISVLPVPSARFQAGDVQGAESPPSGRDVQWARGRELVLHTGQLTWAGPGTGGLGWVWSLAGV